MGPGLGSQALARGRRLSLNSQWRQRSSVASGGVAAHSDDDVGVVSVCFECTPVSCEFCAAAAERAFGHLLRLFRWAFTKLQVFRRRNAYCAWVCGFWGILV